MQEKSVSNRFNLNHGMAFAYRLGDFVEKTVGNAITASHLEAPVPEGDISDGAWYRLPVSEGLSGDGSEYYVYVRQGTSRHLCIFFSGGGMAWNEYTAARPVSGGKLTAGMPNYYWNNLRPFTQIMNIRVGLTDLVNPLNPFKDWSFLIVTYATGDLHVGENDFPYTAEDGSQQIVHFHGRRNFRAAMEHAVVYFPDPDKLLIAGDSAGAFAVPALTDEILSRYYPKCTDATLFQTADSSCIRTGSGRRGTSGRRRTVCGRPSIRRISRWTGTTSYSRSTGTVSATFMPVRRTIICSAPIIMTLSARPIQLTKMYRKLF